MALLVLCLSSLLHEGCTQRHEILAIESTTLIDGRTGSPRERVTILAEGGRIISVVASERAAIPTQARIIDGRGMWVTPGFVDVHVHNATGDYLRRMLAMGVTSIHLMPHFPPDSPAAPERKSRRPRTPSPRIQMSKMFTGEFPDNLSPGVYELIKPTSVTEAERAVQLLKKQGFRQIKIIQDDGLLWAGPDLLSPRLEEAVFNALAAEAHALGMRVYVHATQLADTRMAIRAGAEAFMHGTFDALLDHADWEGMRARRTVWTPAYGVIIRSLDSERYARFILADANLRAALSADELSELTAYSQGKEPMPAPSRAVTEKLDEYLETLGRNTRRAQDEPVPVAVGSDGGPAGVSTHLEMELVQNQGLTAAEALVAATYGGALALGEGNDIGTIEVGKLANLVILRANPVTDIRNARQIEWVIKGGVAFRPSELLAEAEKKQ
jgi:imidazolonepropionase-like amidohydrolase